MPVLTVRVLRPMLAHVLLDFPEHSATSVCPPLFLLMLIALVRNLFFQRSALLDAVKEPVMVSPIHVHVIQAGREIYATSQSANRDVYKESVSSLHNTIEAH